MKQWPERAAQALNDIEAATAEAFIALDEFDHERLARALDDIVGHVEAFQTGPTGQAPDRARTSQPQDKSHKSQNSA